MGNVVAHQNVEILRRFIFKAPRNERGQKSGTKLKNETVHMLYFNIIYREQNKCKTLTH